MVFLLRQVALIVREQGAAAAPGFSCNLSAVLYYIYIGYSKREGSSTGCHYWAGQLPYST
jgi:hypothetical protein